MDLYGAGQNDIEQAAAWLTEAGDELGTGGKTAAGYGYLALTQMPGNFSQGWPGLVFLSSYVFVPEQQRPKLPDEESGSYQTLGGFVMMEVGRVRVTGDVFDSEGYRFEVVDMDGKRVDKVLVSKAPSKPEIPDDSVDDERI